MDEQKKFLWIAFISAFLFVFGVGRALPETVISIGDSSASWFFWSQVTQISVVIANIAFLLTVLFSILAIFKKIGDKAELFVIGSFIIGIGLWIIALIIILVWWLTIGS